MGLFGRGHVQAGAWRDLRAQSLTPPFPPPSLDVFYKPIGLGCGHRMCKGCALGAAGFSAVTGTLHNICSYIPASTTCPVCRQPGVYSGAMHLTEFAHLVQLRHPKAYAQRKSEERARAAERNPRLTQMTALSPFDMLASM